VHSPRQQRRNTSSHARPNQAAVVSALAQDLHEPAFSIFSDESKRFPLILTLDQNGIPHRWITWQHAVWYYAKQRVAWETGSKAFTVNGKTYPNTLTILQRNEVVPEGPFNPQFFKQYDYSIEVYAKGIGLIYKNLDHKVWQPPTPPPDSRPGYWEDGSFRIILSALDNN
jgi:hypothetical protein